MRDLKELFRLRFDLKLTQRQAARASGFSRSTAQDYERRALAAGILSSEAIVNLSPEELSNKLGFSKPVHKVGDDSKTDKVIPDWAQFRQELSRHRHLTLMLLWTEYKEKYLDKSYQYSQFCELYKRWSKKISICFRQEHKAGEKVFVDYAGTRFSVTNFETGEVKVAEVFVGVLGASSYVFAEATWTQGLPDWLMSHRKMFEFFGGVSEIIVPDNLKSGITRPDRYEATINKSYREFSEHYDTCVIPARVRKPQDKAKVEVSVQVVTRWITMALRNKTFFSLEELNDSFRVLLKKLNEKKMRHLGKSRAELFELLDKPALKPLPAKPFEFGEWKRVRINIDYHFEFDKALYSVPYQLTGEELWVRASSFTIEVYKDLHRVCSHRRTYIERKMITEPSHRPPSHQEHLKWTPERITKWADSKGADVGAFIAKLIASKRHPEQAYRSALGCIRLADKFGDERLNLACKKALSYGSSNYQTVKNMLKNNMEKIENEKPKQLSLIEQFTDSENVRGAEFYH